MSEMGRLQGPLTEAVASAGYTMAVSLYIAMVDKGIMTSTEARKAFKYWSKKSKKLEGTANHDAAVLLSDLAKYFNVTVPPAAKAGRKRSRKAKE
jgi:hypothetical protein